MFAAILAACAGVEPAPLARGHNEMSLRLPALVLAAGLAACAPMQWVKRDAAAGELETALQECQREAWREAQWRAWAYQPMFPFVHQDALGRRYVAWPGSPFADPFGSQFFEESRLMHFCMRAKGWELEPVEKK
jgi:hypothetical protein